MERFVDAARGVRLWVEQVPCAVTVPAEPLLLVTDADRPGPAWPDVLVTALAERHPVVRYDHRDTGRSTATFDAQPYDLVDLAADAVAVLDGLGVPRAHVVGLGMGGLIVQLLLLDHPDRLVSATVVCAGPLPTPGAAMLPGPDDALLRLWGETDDERDAGSELAWRVAQARLLHGTGTPFDAAESRALERRIIAHTGHSEPGTAHSRMTTTRAQRGAELAGVEVPTLVIEAPDDPVHPPPHAEHLARALGRGRLVRIPGMGHAVDGAVVVPVAAAVLAQTSGRYAPS